mgnify:CR=1 FL=1
MNKELLRSTAAAMGIVAAITGAVVTAYAVKKRKPISKTVKGDLTALVENIKDASATTLHNKVGQPVYKFLKNKEHIPF